MKRKIIAVALILVLVICAAFVGCGNNSEDPTAASSSAASASEAEAAPSSEAPVESADVDTQLQVIANSIDVWLISTDDAYESFSYCITDLDGDGRLEIIACNSGGTGMYTFSKYYEVNADFAGITECEHVFSGDSQADVVVDTADCYTDAQTGAVSYVFDDFIRNGYAESFNNKVALTLSDSGVEEKILACEATVYTDEENSTVTYTDAENREIDKAQYDAVESTTFSGFEKKTLSLGWNNFDAEGNAKLKELADGELLNLLTASYEEFTIA